MTLPDKQFIDNLSSKDLELLNSSVGLRYLFADKKTNVERALRLSLYETKLAKITGKTNKSSKLDNCQQ